MSKVRVTWVGHSTVLFDVDGYRVIPDPLLTRRVAQLRRRVAMPSPDVAEVDLVLLSHAHMDHLHVPSLRRLDAAADVITTRGTASLLGGIGFRDVTEVDPGDRVSIGSVIVDTTEAVHKPGRGPHSRVVAPPVGYIIEAGGQRIYFPGDTDLFDGMADLAPVDVAMLPIWGWGPTIGEGHLDPERAAQATARIKPRVVIPIHWGTYAPENGRRRMPTWFQNPVTQFSEELARIGEQGRLEKLLPGETLDVHDA